MNDPKIIVRHVLFVEGDSGVQPVGGRLFKGETEAAFPRECLEKNRDFKFQFDDMEEARRAAVKLQDYIQKTAKGKTAK